MREVAIRELGNTQYLISYGGSFSFRAAVDNGVTYIGFADLAECCGYKAGGKYALRSGIPKVKLNARHIDGRTVGNVTPMWFLTMDDATQFVRERALDQDFKKWFIGYAENLRRLPVSAPSESAQPPSRPAQGKSKAPAAQPSTGVNISPELIDSIIVGLLALKQGMTSSGTS